MENVVVHIISHSHWDREWYLPFESHRMQLVELFDDLFDLFENDPEFKSFHLDGQTIVLDDYLEIRPENRDKVQRYIDEGKLKIGPFYILQDDYLISSEANVRNTLIGQAECAKWGNLLRSVTSQTPLEIWDRLLKSFKNQGFTSQPLVAVSSQSDLTTKSSKMSSLPLNFLKCTGKGLMVAVYSVSSLLTGIVMGTKFQWIKTKP